MSSAVPPLYDPKVPRSLKNLQEWFGSIISRPIDLSDAMNMISPSGHPMKEEAAKYISASPTLDSHKRLELYNQQYWWRILDLLHSCYPMLTRLFGYSNFNTKFAFPYITSYPSQNWAIDFIGQNLPRWIEDSYKSEDRDFVLSAAKLDWAFYYAFYAPERTPLSNDPRAQKDFSALLEIPLTLQSHITLFHFSSHILHLRKALLLQKEGDYWLNHPMPQLEQSEKEYFFIVYRKPNYKISWKEIGQAEYCLLKLLERGISLIDACDKLEDVGSDIAIKASEEIGQWFQEWTILQWISAQ